MAASSAPAATGASAVAAAAAAAALTGRLPSTADAPSPSSYPPSHPTAPHRHNSSNNMAAPLSNPPDPNSHLPGANPLASNAVTNQTSLAACSLQKLLCPPASGSSNLSGSTSGGGRAASDLVQLGSNLGSLNWTGSNASALLGGSGQLSGILPTQGGAKHFLSKGQGMSGILRVASQGIGGSSGMWASTMEASTDRNWEGSTAPLFGLQSHALQGLSGEGLNAALAASLNATGQAGGGLGPSFVLPGLTAEASARVRRMLDPPLPRSPQQLQGRLAVQPQGRQHGEEEKE